MNAESGSEGRLSPQPSPQKRGFPVWAMVTLAAIGVFVVLGIVVTIIGAVEEEKTTSGDSQAPVATTAAAPTTPPAPATTAVPASGQAAFAPVPGMVGKDLQEAQDALQAAGFYVLTSHDATGQNRYQGLDRNWKVCEQTPPPWTPVRKDTPIDLTVVKDEERCP